MPFNVNAVEIEQDMDVVLVILVNSKYTIRFIKTFVRKYFYNVI